MEIESAMGLRLMAASAAILLLSSVAHAGVAEELTAAINKCAAIADDGMRHACYDRLPTLLKPPAPGAAADAPPPDDGDFDLFASEPPPAVRITATVESFTFDYGVFVVTLDNGQVWRQVATIGDFVHFAKDKKDRVTIWRSRFGYYVLKIEGYHVTYHVRRIK
jgi:hypothetical protein